MAHAAATPPAVAAAAVASHEKHVYVLGSLQSRRAGIDPHLGHPAQTNSPQRLLWRSCRTRGTFTCSARCDRDVPGSAHTGAVRCKLAACLGGRGGRVARTAHKRARYAAIATCRDRPTLGSTGADTPPAVAAAAVAPHARHVYVLGSLRSQCTGSDPYLGRPAPTSRSPWQQRQSRRTSGTHTCPDRYERDAPGSAHPRATRRGYAARRGGGGGRVTRAARVGARLAAIATRRDRPAPGASGANQPPAAAVAALASQGRHAYVSSLL